MQSKNNSFLLSFLNGSIFGGAKDTHNFVESAKKYASPFHWTGVNNEDYKVRELVYFDVFVDVLAANEGVEQDVGHHGHLQPVAEDFAVLLGNDVLQPRHQTTTDDHHHEDTGGSLGVLAQTFNREVEDATPHDRRAETASSDEEYLHRNCMTLNGDGNALGQEDGDEQQDDSNR